jgi:high-affinity Fe2+/Pb2+ permease
MLSDQDDLAEKKAGLIAGAIVAFAAAALVAWGILEFVFRQ